MNAPNTYIICYCIELYYMSYVFTYVAIGRFHNQQQWIKLLTFVVRSSQANKSTLSNKHLRIINTNYCVSLVSMLGRLKQALRLV